MADCDFLMHLSAGEKRPNQLISLSELTQPRQGDKRCPGGWQVALLVVFAKSSPAFNCWRNLLWFQPRNGAHLQTSM
ncbi:hypothetical protein GJ744_010234 [Endocarpon pusillum]|uniref:Uncharacterized protein n=1 Tax=Endocarpon pusillum TaxID=364733 RepID=A0A8H7AII4_9EURO|nr:hypothetical protein GJ744_010234 [Endocarpon pusillum]